MRRTIFLLALLIATTAGAAEPVVSPAWLRSHLNDKDLVLLHVGDKAEYAAAHIPGARYVSLNDVAVMHTDTMLMLEMPDANDLHGRLEALGISDNSHVVVYFGKDWLSPTTRVIYTLDYAGLGSHASLLDGGMPAWKKSGGETTTEVPKGSKGTLAALKIRPIVVDADFVHAHLNTKGYAIVDGRDAVYYDGVDTPDSMGEKHKTGHLPGAKSIPFTSVANDDMVLKSHAQLEELFTKAGVKPDDTVIGYCHIGQQTTAMLFAARLLGHPVLLYDGSMQDWSRHKDFPTETPSK
jgi:thiosulfate/3-mercaptopyruvate sulfurtransferase